MQYLVENPNGATVSILFPKDGGEYDLENIIKSIQKMDELSPKCDFIITGGEPFSVNKIPVLRSILDAISALKSPHRLFMDTLMLQYYDSDKDIILEILDRYRACITGLNILRRTDNTTEYDIDFLYEINKICPVRISVEVAGRDLKNMSAVLLFKLNYSDFPIQYKRSNKNISYTDLISPDQYFVRLRDIYAAHQIKVASDIKTNQSYWTVSDNAVYHVKLPYSKVPIGNDRYILVDIIIDGSGLILEEWPEYSLNLDLLNLDLYEQRQIFYRGEEC